MKKINLIWMTGIILISLLGAVYAVDCGTYCSPGTDCTITSSCTWDQRTYSFKSLSVQASTSRGDWLQLNIYSQGDLNITNTGSITCNACNLNLISGGEFSCQGSI